jgi:pSer/pThr/pTyr-binding forkhead associated (FHA) protein
MKWALMVDRGKQKGTIIPIRKSPFVMGRGEDCHLRTANSYVSHRHCELQTDGEKITIRDCQSTNGTFINSEKISSEVELHEGDRLKIGSLTFVVCQEEKVSEAASSGDSPISDSEPTPEPNPPQEPRKVDEDAIGDMLLDLDEEDSGPPAGAWKKNSSPDANPERSSETPQRVAARRASSAPDIASKMLKGKDTSWIKPK